MENKHSNMESDEWAIGIIFYLLCSDVHPFPSEVMINKKTDREKAEFLKTHKVTFPSEFFKDRGLS